MNTKEINFDYDLVRDFMPKTGWEYWKFVVFAFVAWLGILIEFYKYYQIGVRTFWIVILVFFVLLFSVFLLSAIRGKPFGKEGNVFLKIENGRVHSKRSSFASERKISLDRLEKIDITEKRIFLVERGGDALHIKTAQIQNPIKRAELFILLNDLKLKI